MPMSVFAKKFKKVAKKVTAWSLAALTAATCASTLPAVLTTKVNAAAGILSNEERGVIYANSRTDFRDESIYFLITTRFYDGDSSNNYRSADDDNAHNPESDPQWRGDFKGLIDKLDYIKALGFTAIWITPVVQNRSGYDYHGYHAYNFSAVDNRYESNGVTYQTLIDAVHAKGMKIIQDVVVNHTCNFGEENLLKIGNEDDYPARTKVVMNGTGDPENIYHHNEFCGGGDWDNYEAQDKSIAGDCFDLETENPKVYNYLNDCYTKYIKMGVDGFRIDTVKHVSRLTFNAAFLPAWKAAGGDDFFMFGEICTKGHDVWYRDHPPISTCFYTWADDSSWLGKWSSTSLETNEALVKQHYNDHNNTGSQPTSTNAFLNGNDYHTPDYSKRSGMDAIDFQMHWSFNDANSAFNTAKGEDKYFNDSTWNVVYVDSHDYAPDQNQTQRYTGGTNKWAENLALMFTFRGIPCIYYGSEIEFQAGKPIDVGQNAPLSETGRAYYGDKIEGSVTASDFTVFGNVSGEVQNTLNATLSQHIMRLNRIRQAVPALRKGQYSTEGCNGNMAFKRRYTDANTDSFACVTISGGATFSGIPNGTYVDAVTGDTQNVTGGTLTANCSGQGNMRVYVLSTSKTPAPGRVIPNGDYLTDGGAAEKIGPAPINIVEDTGVSVSPATVTVKQAETAQVTATVTPSNATYKTVTWTSSNDAVATVSGGTIKGVSVGTATITAKTHSGKTATVNVKVTKNDSIVDPTGISISPSTLTITAGETGSLTATVTPSNATDKSVTWKSSDESVATVKNGTVTALKAGSATITATTSNGKTATASITVEGKSIKYIDHGIYFEKPSNWGSTLYAYIYDGVANSPDGVGPAWPGTQMTDNGNGTYYLEFTSTKSNLKVIFNDGANQVPASQMPGYDYKDLGYYTEAGWQYTVEKPVNVEVTGVSLSASSATVNVGSTTTLTASVAPSNATNKSITWSSSNPSVATVSGGVVTGVAAGTATITASSNNGKTATASVTVKDSPIPTSLTNNSKLSASTISLGDSVTVTAAASGGTSPYEYAVFYKQNSQSSWTKARGYASGTSVKITPKAATKYTIRVKAKDSDGTIKDKDLSLTVGNTKKSSLSKNAITLGESVTVTCSEDKAVSYAVFYKQTSQSSWTKVRDYAAGTTVKVTPKASTTYTIRVKAKDSSGNVKSRDLSLKVNPGSFANTSKVSANTINLGSTLTVTCASTGGTGTKQYAVFYKQNSQSSWTKVRGYATGTSVKVTPKASTTYTIRVKAKDGAGTVKDKDFAVTVKPSPLANTSKVSATSIAYGSSVTVTCASTGGTGTKQYAVFYIKSGQTEWTKVKGYNTTATAKVTPKGTGTYKIRVKAKDSANTVENKDFTITVTAALANTSKVSSSTVNLGSAVTVTCASTGGTGTKQYAVFYKQNSQSSWTKVRDYATGTSVKVTPKAVTTYTIRVKVKDGKNNVVNKDITVVVKDPNALTNNSKIGATTVTAGGSLKVTCAAVNGTSPYYYNIERMKAGETGWTTVKKYAAVSSVNVTFPSKGTYQVKVTVMDMEGKTAISYFTVTAK